MIKIFYQGKLNFLPLFWFVIKNIDIFPPAIMDSEESGPKIWHKKFIESKVQPFCLLEQTLFPGYLCVFLHKWTLKWLKTHQSWEEYRLNMSDGKGLKNMKKFCQNLELTHVKWEPESYPPFLIMKGSKIIFFSETLHGYLSL